MESGLWADDEGLEYRRQILGMPKRQAGETSDELDVVGEVEERVRDASEGSVQAAECLVTPLTQAGQIGYERDGFGVMGKKVMDFVLDLLSLRCPVTSRQRYTLGH